MMTARDAPSVYSIYEKTGSAIGGERVIIMKLKEKIKINIKAQVRISTQHLDDDSLVMTMILLTSCLTKEVPQSLETVYRAVFNRQINNGTVYWHETR